MVFNSRKIEYKTPYGAAESGTVVRFRIIPEAHRFPLRGVLVCELEDENGVAYKEVTLKKTDAEFTAELDTTGFCGLVHYAFRFSNDGGSFFYGARRGSVGGEAEFYGGEKPAPFQLTVYRPHPQGAEWFGSGITYQIFPDRFNIGGELDIANQPSYRVFHKETDETPVYKMEQFDGRMQVTNRDFFGGNLRGIIEKLDYLSELCVSTIYLNPIFAAFSNHRYDTGDYHEIDSLLGTADDFRELCSLAKERGMRVILDGVFSHTGADSRYFNRRGTYDDVGAYQSKESPYYKWFNFQDWPNVYSSWWGDIILPETREDEPEFANFIADAENPDCVIRRWLRDGASGWRLDVADELPDGFIERIKAAAYSEKPDAIVLGEVWEDASNKVSYGARRRYLLGGSLDSVMGYTFRTAAIEYLKGGSAAGFVEAIETVRENYPSFAFNNMMNLLGTHDTPRVLSLLGTSDGALWQTPKEQRAELRLDAAAREYAVTLYALGAVLQYTLPGCPSVYYGDEAGMEGADDPFCRRFYPWGREDRELLALHKRLGEARAKSEALQRGAFEFLPAPEAVVAFKRELNGKTVYVITNRADTTQAVALPHGKYHDMLSGRGIVCGGMLFVSRETALILQKQNESD